MPSRLPRLSSLIRLPSRMTALWAMSRPTRSVAAAVLTELWGGSPGQCAHAAAIALKCLLGLACDPVAGLVEVPCVKRNASGLANALCAAQLALAGVASAVPCDEVIEAMRAVGDAMPCALRETAQGGLAATPTGIQWKKRLFQ